MIGWDGLACVRGDRLLFEELSGEVAAGGALVLTGPNGAGKSSLMRVLAGLLRPDAGRVRRDAALGLADERPALDPRLPLARALGWWARLDGRGPADVARGLGAMALEALAEVPVRILSTGQRRRAGLARLIAGGQPLWLLDEPGNGLDAASLKLLADAMAAHRAGGGAVIAATHADIGLGDAPVLRLG